VNADDEPQGPVFDDDKPEHSDDNKPGPFGDGFTSEIENRQPRQVEEVEVQVVGVYEHQEQGQTPGFSPPAFVLLRDKENRQVLIFIGRAEAFAISLALEDKTVDRPLTHDLMKSILDHLDVKIDRILIDDIWQETYYAKITLNMGDKTVQIDARPSDAIALGLRAKAPLYMAEYVLQQASISEDIPDGPEQQ